MLGIRHHQQKISVHHTIVGKRKDGYRKADRGEGNVLGAYKETPTGGCDSDVAFDSIPTFEIFRFYFDTNGKNGTIRKMRIVEVVRFILFNYKKMRLAEMIYTEEEMQELREENRLLKNEIAWLKDHTKYNGITEEYYIDGTMTATEAKLRLQQAEDNKNYVSKLEEENKKLEHKNELQEKALIKLCLKHNYDVIIIDGEEVIYMGNYKVVEKKKPKEEKLF